MSSSLDGVGFTGMPGPASTPRLAFREMTSNDLDDLAALLGDPQIMRHYPSRAASRRWPGSPGPPAVSRARRRAVAADAAHGRGVRRRPRPDPQQVDGVTELKVVYHLRAALQVNGLATEAAAACCDSVSTITGPLAQPPAHLCRLPSPPWGSAERRMALDRRHVALDVLVRSDGASERYRSACPIFGQELIRNCVQSDYVPMVREAIDLTVAGVPVRAGGRAGSPVSDHEYRELAHVRDQRNRFAHPSGASPTRA
jgi:hypothetical protein